MHKLFVADYSAMLDEALVNGRRDGIPEAIICEAFLSHEEIQDLISFIEVLQNALKHRSEVGFREARCWHSAVDFKMGGMNKLIGAADAPLKCAIGLVKRALPEDSNWTVGVMASISLNPRATCQRFRLGYPKSGFLAGLNLNVWHMVRPDRLRAQFHEAGHLLWNMVAVEKKLSPLIDPDGSNIYKSDPNLSERIAEIFSEMFVYAFVFRGEPRIFMRSYMAAYSLDPISLCLQSSSTLVRMTEVLIRGFLSVDPFELVAVGRPQLIHPYTTEENYELQDADFKAALERFLALIEDAGPLFFDFTRLYKTKSGSDYIKKQFLAVFTRDFSAIRRIAHYLSGLFTQLGKNKPGMDPTAGDESEIDEEILRGYQRGQPVVRALYCHTGNVAQLPNNDRIKLIFLDTFVVIAKVMRLHVCDLYGEHVLKTDLTVHLPRSTTDGKFVDNFCDEELIKSRPGNDIPDEEPISRQFIDRSFNGFLSADLALRRDQMRKRIMVIKTLWDVSTSLRAQRMNRILESAWPNVLKS